MRQLLLAALVPALVTGCNRGPECVIDTDCPLGQLCSADERCVAIGTDAGVLDAGDEAGLDAGPADAEVDAPMDAGPSIVGFGSVVVMSQPGSHSVSASFFRAAASACTTTTMGPCRVTTCPPPMMVEDAGMPEDAGVPPAAPHTGTITFGGAIIPAIDLVPNEDGTYPVIAGATALWTESSPVMITSTGDAVPRLSLNLTSTEVVTVTGPTEAATPMASDLTIDWSGVSPGDVVVSLIAFGRVSDVNPTAECRFAPGAGGGDVPAGVLAALGAGNTLFTVRSESRNQMVRDGWEVDVALRTSAEFQASVPATLVLE
ncbi:MAG: hypothetical protein KF901_27350 [Myxococcales bacterium]|nr:hypothetical protein [Myxococcales bacterium]